MKKVIEEKRLGHFIISHDLFFRHPDEVLAFLSNVLIIKAEFLVEFYGFMYTAYCKDFDSASPYMKARNYSVGCVYKKLDDETEVVDKLEFLET